MAAVEEAATMKFLRFLRLTTGRCVIIGLGAALLVGWWGMTQLAYGYEILVGGWAIFSQLCGGFVALWALWHIALWVYLTWNRGKLVGNPMDGYFIVGDPPIERRFLSEEQERELSGEVDGDEGTGPALPKSE